MAHEHLRPYVSSLFSNPVWSWIDSHFKKLCTSTLKSGPIPNHVAFIMDGNRRYARSKGFEVLKGHEAGSASLVTIIDACHQLGIANVTIYAFSIENFSRSATEVDKLFELLVDKLNLFLDNEKEYNEIIQIRIIGNKSHIPEQTLRKLEEIERLTSKNHDLVLNVCFSYTSRDEITHSIGKTVTQILDKDLAISQITPDIINNNFYFHSDTPKVDILIRTSGHTRLSDFLIWQVNQDTIIEFTNVYWPEFTTLQYYAILLKWSYSTTLESRIKDWKALATFDETKKVDLKSLKQAPPFVSILGEK